MRRVLQSTAVVLLSLTLGLHWTAIQSMAWTSMIVSRARTGSLSEALRTTFDGQHPCRLCLVVREGRAADRASSESPSGDTTRAGAPTRLDLAPASAPFRLIADGAALPPPAIARAALPSRSDPPPLPPPRFA